MLMDFFAKNGTPFAETTAARTSRASWKRHGGHDPEPGTIIGATEVLRPLDVEGGYARETSNPAARRSCLRLYEDRCSKHWEPRPLLDLQIRER